MTHLLCIMDQASKIVCSLDHTSLPWSSIQWHDSERQGATRHHPTLSLQQEDKTFSKTQFHNVDNSESFPKLLGTSWNNTEDKLVFTFKNLTSYLTNEIVTKRIVLSSAVKVFNPFGILSPVLFAFKILRKESCWLGRFSGRRGTSAVEVLVTWHKAVSRFLIDKCYLPGLKSLETPTFQLHGSGDASDKASDGVVYFKIRSENSVVCKHVASKTRISPLMGAPHPD